MNQDSIAPELRARLHNLRHIALDMDGTIYRGDELFAETLPFLDNLRALGLSFTFLTNNSSKAEAEYLRHLKKFGIEAKSGDLFSSTHAAIALLRRALPAAKRLFAVGTAGFAGQLEAAGFQLSSIEDENAPDAVLIGFDPDLNYRTLCKAAYWIERGLPYYATHPDQVCPTNQPTILLDCGAVCGAIEVATGRKPDAIAGKPEPAMLQALAKNFELECAQIAMIGDRINTDVLMAKRAGGLGVLTLTGATKRADIESSPTKPDLVINNLAEFGVLLQAVHK